MLDDLFAFDADPQWPEEPPTEFLTMADVPVNRLWRVGDLVRTPTREVARVGYRLGMSDAPAIPAEARPHIAALVKLASDGRLQHLPYKARKSLEQCWARTWLAAERMGGPERGVHVRPLVHPHGWVWSTPWEVVAKRNRHIGTYYPPGGGDPGGLEPHRVVVVVTLRNAALDYTLDAIAGDLVTA